MVFFYTHWWNVYREWGFYISKPKGYHPCCHLNVVDQLLGTGGVVVDDRAKLAAKLWVYFINHTLQQHGVFVVAGKKLPPRVPA